MSETLLSPTPTVTAPTVATTVTAPVTIGALECPECAAAVAARPTLTGEILDCTDCGAELEVVSLDPVRVELAPDVEEDWGE